jgi:hypothetical protein
MRILRRATLIAALMALASTPAWALPGKGNSNEHTGKGAPQRPAGKGHSEGDGHSSEGHEEGSKGSKGTGSDHGQGTSKSHRCLAHSIAYVASGTLLSDTLTESTNHTYSGGVVVEVLHGNRHSRSDRGTQKTYTVQAAHLTLAVGDLDEDSVVGVDDLAPGDRVQLIGHITALAKDCPQGAFTPQLTIRKIVFHSPRKGSTSTTTSTTTSTSTSSSTSSTSTTTTSAS